MMTNFYVWVVNYDTAEIQRMEVYSDYEKAKECVDFYSEHFSEMMLNFRGIIDSHFEQWRTIDKEKRMNGDSYGYITIEKILVQ